MQTGRAVVSGTPSTTIGDQALLKQPLLALFCSIKCPGELILKLFDFAKELRLSDMGREAVSRSPTLTSFPTSP